MTDHAGEGAPERSFLSIREVLDLLVAEFPDVTISKIRFLESRGLIHPERTASGYRKFYESDVERLRWILREQREHFLPLKVIKGRLDGVSGAVAPSLFDGDFSDPPEESHELVGARSAHASSSGGGSDPDEFEEFFESGGDEEPSRPLDDDASGPGPSSGGDDTGAGSAPGADAPPTPRRPARATKSAAASRVAAEKPAKKPRRPGGRPPRDGAPGAGSGVTGYSAADLARAAGVDARVVAELDEYGLIVAVEAAGVRAYPPVSLEIVRLATSFGKFGVEPRHLRTFKHAAERETGLFSQVVTPLLYQRNPEARARAATELKELVELGAALHEAFVRAALDDVGRG